MRKISVVFFILFYSSFIWSQKASDLFKTIPFEVVPGLTQEDKEMMMIDTGKVSVPVALGEITKIEHTNTYIKLVTSKVGTTQIKFLEHDSDSLIICVIKTVCDNVCDSSIKFYSTDWEELDSDSFIANKSIDSFINSKEIINYLEPDMALPLYYPIVAQFSGESDDLLLKIDLANIFSKEQIDKMGPLVDKSQIQLKWSGTSFN